MDNIKNFTKCNTDSATIKILAFLFMIVDHIGCTIFSQYPELRMFGRISFPLFAWGIVLGACYTKNIFKYALRVLALGIISQPLYNIVLNHTWDQLNILFTLALGLFAISGIQIKKYFSHIIFPILALLIPRFILVDYGTDGVLFIILLYLAKETKLSIFAFFLSFCLYWGQSSYLVTNIFGVDINYSNTLVQFFAPLLRIQAMSILALPIILINTNSKIRINKYLSYLLYPLHLILIYVLKILIK